MALTDLSGRLFHKNLLQLATNIEWKNEYAARVAEKELSDEDYLKAERYTNAARKLLEYYSVSELKVIADYPYDKFDFFRNNKAPARLVKYLNIFWEYEEKNTYYRMLYGKPPYNCHPKYWVLPKLDNQWGLSPNEPIHDQPIAVLTIFERDGGLDKYKELIKKDKTFEYVNHMTTKKIYPFIARLASRFDLLYVPTADIPKLSTDFKEVYELCRDFMVQRYYSEAYRGQYEHYEGLIGMAILFQTIQQMHIKYLDADITRDFYDLDSIKLIYDAYSVPFFEDIPLIYHRKIVKLMNKLLMYKGDNHVFFDLCNLFDCQSLEIYKYYLVKERKFDIDGKMITSKNPDGTPNYNEMYDIAFYQGNIDGDPYTDITNPNNRLDYNAITSADPYWINDPELYKKAFETDYNYTDTKYIGLQMVFSMTKFLFETGYFIRMIMDNRYKVSFMSVSHGKMGIDIDLFTLIIYIHAIVCLKLGYAGNIPDNIEHIGRIIGFNFKDDIKLIMDDISYNPYIEEEDASILINLLTGIDLSDINSCQKAYSNIKELYQLIDNRLFSCKDPNVYFAYKKLYQILLTTEYNTEIFRKTDGTQATSYMDLLEDLNIGIALRIQAMTDHELVEELQYSLIALQKVTDELKFIQSYGGVNGEVISKYLYKLIRVFKSAKVDLVDFKTIYIVDGRSTNMIKLMVRLKRLGIGFTLPGDVMDLIDDIHLQKLLVSIESGQILKDHYMLNLLQFIIRDRQAFHLWDRLKVGYRNLGIDLESSFDIVDDIEDKNIISGIKSNSLLTDKLIKLE